MLRRYVIESQAGELPWQKNWGPFWSRSGAVRWYHDVAPQAQLIMVYTPPGVTFQWRLRDRKTEMVEPLDLYTGGPTNA